MAFKPPEPRLSSIDGDRFVSLDNYMCNFADWLAPYQFEIRAGTITDIASRPWYLRCFYDRSSLGWIAPFVHDFLCTAKGKYINTFGNEIQISWLGAHVLFLGLMLIDGIPPRRAFLAFVAVLIRNRPIWDANSFRSRD